MEEIKKRARGLEGKGLRSLRLLVGKYEVSEEVKFSVERPPLKPREDFRCTIVFKNDYPKKFVETPLGKKCLEHFLLKKFAYLLEKIEGTKVQVPSRVILDRNGISVRKSRMVFRFWMRPFGMERSSFDSSRFLECISKLSKLHQFISYRSLEDHDREKLKRIVEYAEDQEHLKQKLREEGEIGFISAEAKLPFPWEREPLKLPKDLLVTYELPHYGEIEGLLIRKGITSFFGEKFSGKTTLMRALSLGFYLFEPGSGMEFVKTPEQIPIIETEPGRPVRGLDLSPMIKEAPGLGNLEEVRVYSADHYVSQVASLMEAIEYRVPGVIVEEEFSDPYFVAGEGKRSYSLEQVAVSICDYLDLSLVLSFDTRRGLLSKSYVTYLMDRGKILGREKMGGGGTEDYQVRRPKSRRPNRNFIPEIVKQRVGDRKLRIYGKRGKKAIRYDIPLGKAFRYTIMEKEQLEAILKAMRKVRENLNGKRSLKAAIDSTLEDIYEKGIECLGTHFDYSEFTGWQLVYVINRISMIHRCPEVQNERKRSRRRSFGPASIKSITSFILGFLNLYLLVASLSITLYFSKSFMWKETV